MNLPRLFSFLGHQRTWRLSGGAHGCRDFCIVSEKQRAFVKKMENSTDSQTGREFRRFAYKACTGSFSYFKHTNI